MEKLIFYFTHSWNDLRVGGKRTAFALLCIAAGVAAVVSLQNLGAMIGASLTGNIQELNRGDIRVFPPGPGLNRESVGGIRPENRYLETSGGGAAVFTMEGVQAIEETVQRLDPQARITYRYLSPTNPIIGTFLEVNNASKPILPFIIEVDKYPLYGEILTTDGQTIQTVMKDPTDIVISDNAASDHNLKVGDQVKLNGTNTRFTVRGIVDREAEALSENIIFVTLIGFYYMDTSAVDLFADAERIPSNRHATEIYVALSNGDPAFVSEVTQRLQNRFYFVSVTTTTDLRERNSQITDAVSDLVLLMGFVSLLIGGIGIINTMLVIVARRTTEIAVLKTIGLQARQVTFLFLIESIVLGVIGSIIGCILGVAIAYLLQRSDTFFGTRLAWVFSMEAITRGFILGVLVTAIFGFLPTLIAGQVRPGHVLRPSTTQLPSIGIIHTLIATFVILLALGAISWSIIGGRLSPSIWGRWSILSVALAFAFAFGIGGAAIVPSMPFVNRDPKKLGILNLIVRWGLLLFGMVVQTALQGVLFFAAAIVVVAIINGKITTNSLYLAIGVGVVFGLLVSVQAFLRQRSIFVALGGIMLAFALLFGVGLAVGAGVGWLIYTYTSSQAAIDFFTNLTLVEASFMTAMMMIGVLWFLVTLTARTPSLGIPDVKISLRSLVFNRNRVATTLMALVVGVLTLSLVTMFATSLKRLFAFSLEENLGGNVLVFTLVGSGNWESNLANLEDVLQTTEGIKDYTLIANYQVNFVALEKPDGTRLKRAQLMEQVEANAASGENMTDFLDFTLSNIDGRFVSQALPKKNFSGESRQLNADDEGQQVVVVTGNRAIQLAGVQPGDKLIFEFPKATGNQPRQISFLIVGVTDERLGDIGSDVGSPIYAPIDAFSGISPDAMGGVINIDEDQINVFRRQILDRVSNTIVLETRFLNQIVNRLIDQFTALPFLVAVLNLITGGTVIANSVALSTMERRRQIGVMKSLGVQRERVLAMLLLENGLMGFLAGIIGVGVSLLLLIQLWAFLFDGELKGALPVGTALLLMVLCVGIALLAAILTAWGASGEKPLNVLRNE